jgi:MFS family permease
LAAKELNTSDSLAPFTIGVFLFGAAFSAVPSGEIFHRYGRFWGFSLGCLCQLCGSAVGACGMIWEEEVILFFGCFMVGLGQVHTIRF